MKIKIEKVVNQSKNSVKNLKLIRDGETSLTYLGLFNNKKSIFKLFKNKSPSIFKNSFYANRIHEELIQQHLFPKILFNDQKNNIYVYEYFNGTEIKKINNEVIISIGRKVRKLHSLKLNKKLKTFYSQFNLYKEEL